MKKMFCAVLTALVCCVTVFAQGEEDGIQVQAIPATQGAAVNAGAAIVIEATTGRVLFQQDADARLPIASTTKILTALMTLEQPGLDEVFEVDAAAIQVEGSSMGLVEGDKVTLRTLATGMLLASGNDAANAAAVRISGSVPTFVTAMNQRAAALGLQNTSFETPSGLDGDNHYSSAADLAMIAREALNNPEFAAICSQYKMRAEYGNPPYERWLTNHNKLLNYYEGTIGVKTGFTKKAGRCLVSAARRDGVTLICVTLDCPSDWSVHQELYDRFFGTIQVEDLSQDMPEVKIPVVGGTKEEVQAAHYDDAQVPVPVSGADIAYRVKGDAFVYAPVLAGQYLGEADILMDGQVVATLTLTAGEDVPLLYEYEEKRTFLEWLEDVFQQDD